MGTAGNRGQTLQRVVSADGVSQYLDCAGSGSPTLVVIPGLDSGVSDWLGELPALRRLTRTCVYDRPGIGDSPPREGSADVDAGLHASELSAALAEARESGPSLCWDLLRRTRSACIHEQGSRAGRRPAARRGCLAQRTHQRGGLAGSRNAGEPLAQLRSNRDGPGLGDLPLVVLSA